MNGACAGRGLPFSLMAQAALLSVFLGGPASADTPGGGEFRKYSSSWTEKIRAGQVVRVDNAYGNVFARFGGYENEVEIVGTFQRLEADKPELQVRLSHAADGLDATVGFTGATGKDGAAPAAAIESRDRVDLVVFVPQGATLDVKTVRGAIETEKIQGNVVAESVKGDIRIRAIKGRATARTKRGRIAATLENGVTEQAQEFVTETGDIEVYLWEDANMNVSLATSGLIGTDFSVEIEHKRLEEPNKRAVAIVGRGGPRLTLESKEGQISLRLLQHGFRTDGSAPERDEDQDPD